MDRLLGTGDHIHEIANSVKEQCFEIDRYQIVKEIGRGGMRVVYLSERTDGEFGQKVAVKISSRLGSTGRIVFAGFVPNAKSSPP